MGFNCRFGWGRVLMLFWGAFIFGRRVTFLFPLAVGIANSLDRSSNPQAPSCQRTSAGIRDGESSSSEDVTWDVDPLTDSSSLLSPNIPSSELSCLSLSVPSATSSRNVSSSSLRSGTPSGKNNRFPSSSIPESARTALTLRLKVFLRIAGGDAANSLRSLWLRLCRDFSPSMGAHPLNPNLNFIDRISSSGLSSLKQLIRGMLEFHLSFLSSLCCSCFRRLSASAFNCP
mmetsp:Transcript_28052/g.52950  ORF Transcript_28052/g.52950 Transcript_28052/m.52950 type:complete len:230 (+) Transcript_28052:4927-5616(+)